MFRPTDPSQRVGPIFVLVALVIGLIGPTRFARSARALVLDPEPVQSPAVIASVPAIASTPRPPQPDSPPKERAPAPSVVAPVTERYPISLERDHDFQCDEMSVENNALTCSWSDIPMFDGRKKAYAYALTRITPAVRLTPGRYQLEGAYLWRGGRGVLKLELKSPHGLLGGGMLPVPPPSESVHRIATLEVTEPETLSLLAAVSEPHTGDAPSSGHLTLSQLTLVRER